MAKAITAQQVMAKWAAAGANSENTVRAGVQAVNESPTAKAAARVDAWVAGVQRSRDKFVNNLQAVSLQDWKNAMLGKGLQNMVNGYNDRFNQQKFLNFMNQFLPYVREGAQRVRMMPKNNLQDSINRAAEMIRHNARFRANAAVGNLPGNFAGVGPGG